MTHFDSDDDLLDLNVQGVCKDCGNGTLNNSTNPAFDVNTDLGTITCLTCGSEHLDLLAY
jgi:hypothetical protein